MPPHVRAPSPPVFSYPCPTFLPVKLSRLFFGISQQRRVALDLWATYVACLSPGPHLVYRFARCRVVTVQHWFAITPANPSCRCATIGESVECWTSTLPTTPVLSTIPHRACQAEGWMDLSLEPLFTAHLRTFCPFLGRLG